MLDNVGGPQLVAGFEALRAGDALISSGTPRVPGRRSSSAVQPNRRPARPLDSEFLPAGGRVRRFHRRPQVARAEVAGGRLDPQITWRGDWEKHAGATAALLGCRLHGKAVLEVS